MEVRLPLLPRSVRWGGVAAVAAAIFWFSVLTAPPETAVVPKPDLLPLDKWRHFLAYAALAGALGYATADADPPRRRLALAVLGVTVAYGVGIELVQAALPARYFSVWDAYANALGAVLFMPYYAVRGYVTYRPVVPEG